MTFDKKAYQRDYMRKHRAGQPSEKRRLREALEQIATRLEGRPSALAGELRAIVTEALDTK